MRSNVPVKAGTSEIAVQILLPFGNTLYDRQPNTGGTPLKSLYPFQISQMRK